jgi:hypothetical protein
MGKRKKAHRAYAGGRRRHFRKMIREYHTAGDFDPSVFPSPRLDPLPPPEEVTEALGAEKPSMPALEPTPSKDSEQTASPAVPATRRAARTFTKPVGVANRKPARAVPDFVPIRVPTRPLPLSATIRRSEVPSEEILSTTPRKLPKVKEISRANFELQRTPTGYIALIYD